MAFLSFDSLSVQRRMAIFGLAQVFVGCAWGFVIPHTTYPRAGLTAHMEFCQNGTLQLAMAYAASLMSVSANLFMAYELCTLIGTWPNGLAAVAGAMSGKITPMAPLIAAQAPAPNGFSAIGPHHWLLFLCGALFPAFGIGIYGIAKAQKSQKGKKQT